jgi:hypothetical protein
MSLDDLLRSTLKMDYMYGCWRSDIWDPYSEPIPSCKKFPDDYQTLTRYIKIYFELEPDKNYSPFIDYFNQHLLMLMRDHSVIVCHDYTRIGHFVLNSAFNIDEVLLKIKNIYRTQILKSILRN